MFISPGASSMQSKVFSQGGRFHQPECSTPAFPQEAPPVAGVDDTDWFAAALSQPEPSIPESLALPDAEEAELWDTVLDVLKSPPRSLSPKPQEIAGLAPTILADNADALAQPQSPLSGVSNPFAFQSDSNPEIMGRTPSLNKRPSRHVQYQDVLTSPETDDEIESSNKETRKNAKHRVRDRRYREKRAKELRVGETGPGYHQDWKAARAQDSSNKRPSRHLQYHNVLTSPETDDEIESADKEIQRKAKQRVGNKRFMEKKAKELGLAGGAAAYVQYRKVQRAKKMGIGATAVEYDRYMKAEKAKALDVGETAADYERYQRAQKAQKLGVGATATDYDRYMKAKRAKIAKKTEN